MAHREPGPAGLHQGRYTRHIKIHLIPALGQLRLLDLRAHHIEAMFTDIIAKNPARERAIGPTTTHGSTQPSTAP
jgi:hypothetical protein